jgi:hypothetical protein
MIKIPTIKDNVSQTESNNHSSIKKGHGLFCVPVAKIIDGSCRTLLSCDQTLICTNALHISAYFTYYKLWETNADSLWLVYSPICSCKPQTGSPKIYGICSKLAITFKGSYPSTGIKDKKKCLPFY